MTRLAEEMAAPFGVEIERTKVSLPALMEAVDRRPMSPSRGRSAAATSFPQFLPAFDALMSLGKLLELLAPSAVPLSEQVAGDPVEHAGPQDRRLPWSLKGTVMRTVTEELQRSDGHDLSLLDGIKVFYKGGWAQILPDADEALFHIYAEGVDADASEQMAESFVARVRAVIAANSD